MNNQKQPKNQAIWIIAIIVVLALAAYGIWYANSGKNNNMNNKNTNTTNTVSITNVNTNLNENINVNTAVNGNANANVNTNTNASTNTNSSTIDTSDWLTYTNEEFGYSVKYPQNWESIEITNMVTNLKPKERSYMYEGGTFYPVGITGYSDNIDEFLSQIPDERKSGVIINNQQAIKVISSYLEVESYVIPHSNSKSFVVIGSNVKELFNAGNIDEAEKNYLESTFNSIIETLNLD